MNYRLIDEYIGEATKNMGTRQRDEVARELRTHIMDNADALAAERKTAVDDAIISEVLAKMGPANRMATMYQKQKPLTRSGRPKMVPSPSKIDLVVEAIALIGFLLSIGLVIYGSINLPETVPTHVGPSGGIDSYGSKWVLLAVLLLSNVLLYALCTITNRYPYIFNYPVIVTEENAPRLYPIAQRMLRWTKAIFAWMFAITAWRFIVVLPYNPGQSVSGLLVIAVSSVMFVIVLAYYVIKIIKVSKPQ